MQVSGGGRWPTIKLLLCLGFWTLWRLLWARLALRKEKRIAAYWSRVLRATNCCCHWHRDQLLLEKTANFPDPSPQLCSQPLPDLNNHIPDGLWLTHFNLTPNPVLLPKEYLQPLTEHSSTSGCSLNALQLEGHFLQRRKKNMSLSAPASNTEEIYWMQDCV